MPPAHPTTETPSIDHPEIYLLGTAARKLLQNIRFRFGFRLLGRSRGICRLEYSNQSCLCPHRPPRRARRFNIPLRIDSESVLYRTGAGACSGLALEPAAVAAAGSAVLVEGVVVVVDA